nr:mechanosensitive ion channel protein 6-like [Ipomoea batatas]
MDRLPCSLRKSLKSHVSFKKQRPRGIYGSNADDDDEEEDYRPILFANRHPDDVPNPSDVGSSIMKRSSLNPDDDDRPEVIVKIDGDNSNSSTSRGVIWDDNLEDGIKGIQRSKSKSKSKSKDVTEDPPSKLIGQFLNKQREGEMCLDMDLEMDELRHRRHSGNDSSCSSAPPPTDQHHQIHRTTTSKEHKVQFLQDGAGGCTTPPSRVVDIIGAEYEQNAEDCSSSTSDDEGGVIEHRQPEYSRRRTSGMISPNINEGREDQVVRCTSSFQRRGGNSFAGRMTNKTKSRLMDDPNASEIMKASGRYGKSVPMRSEMLGVGKGGGGGGGGGGEEEEEDPLLDEDIPDEFKEAKVNALTLAQWASLVIIVTALICTLSIGRLKENRLRGLRLWKWEALILVLICGRLVSGWAIRVAVFFIERNFLLRKRLLYFVYGVRNAVQNCIWLGLVLIAWRSMFDRKLEANNEFLQLVNKLMVCMLIGITLWLVKTLMVKVLASSFHVSKFFDRIQESLFNQYVIETLSGPAWIEIQCQREEEERILAEVRKLQSAGAKGGAAEEQNSGGAGAPPPGITIDHLHKLNPKNVSAWSMKRLVKIIRHGVLSTLDEQIRCSAQDDDSAHQIRSEVEAKIAARKIFRNVAKPKSNFIFLNDLRRFLQETEAVQVMNVLDGSPNCEKISKASLKNWVVNAFRERRALALTLDDTKTAVKKLHQMITVLVCIIIILICLVILGFATGRVLLYISSQVVIVAFIFGNTCKTIFEAIIFLFVVHPFDVGDRCEVDGVELVVEEMNILSTVFLRVDNQKIVYPNSILAMRPIGNFYRSPDMGDTVDFLVHMATPMEKIKAVNQRIVNYVESKKEHWYSSPMIVMNNIPDVHKLKMSVWLRHRMNYQDTGERWTRRSQVIEEMVKIFKELDMEYRLYPMDINVRAMPPIQSTRLPPKWQPPINPNPIVPMASDAALHASPSTSINYSNSL